jgi:carbamoyl-phosphate synthase large subunit
LSAPERPVVAVTGLEGRDNPYPGAAIARALRTARRDSISLVGFAYEPTLTGNFREDLFDRIYLTPLPGDPAATLLRRIFEIHEEYPLDVLIPALDSELALFAAHRAELAERGIRMVIPSLEAVKSRYKQRLFAWGQRHSISVPRTEVVTKPESFWEQESWSLPCYLKGPLADAVRVESVAEAICVWHRLVRRWGYPVLAQRIVNGEEYDVCALAAPGGEAVGAICLVKTILSATGKGIGAEVVDSPEALAAASRVLEALQWEGPLEIEMVREHSSGRFFLIEVNARFPAWIGIAPEAGLNLPDLLLRLALGEPLPENRVAQADTRFLRGSKTTISHVGRLGTLLESGRLIHRND